MRLNLRTVFQNTPGNFTLALPFGGRGIGSAIWTSGVASAISASLTILFLKFLHSRFFAGNHVGLFWAVVACLVFSFASSKRN